MEVTMYRLKAHQKLPAKEFQSHNRFAGSALTILAILLLASTFAHAQGSPFDTGFNALQTLFTGTIAKVASLIAIVIGGGLGAGGALLTANPARRKALARLQPRWWLGCTNCLLSMQKLAETR